MPNPPIIKGVRQIQGVTPPPGYVLDGAVDTETGLGINLGNIITTFTEAARVKRDARNLGIGGWYEENFGNIENPGGKGQRSKEGR